jgi:hypothetical protein
MLRKASRLRSGLESRRRRDYVKAVLFGVIAMVRQYVLPVVLAAFLADPASAAGTDRDALADALALPELFDILHEEGVDYAARLEDELFPGRGGARWDAAIASIYSVDRIFPQFLDRLESELAAQDADTGALVEYLTGDEASRIVALELDARRAFLDDGIREAAEERATQMAVENHPRYAMLQGFVAGTDMLEANVANAMNASLAFYKGMAEGGAMAADMSERDMLDLVWSQEPDVRAETETWVYAYLATSYAPLDDDALARYVAFYATEPGRDLNQALFAAFDAVFTDVSHELGRAAALQLVSQDL